MNYASATGSVPAIFLSLDNGQVIVVLFLMVLVFIGWLAYKFINIFTKEKEMLEK